jgi:hypothetical protein
MYVVSSAAVSNGVCGVRCGHVFFAGACVAAAAAPAFRLPSAFLDIQKQKKGACLFFPLRRYIGDNQYIAGIFTILVSPITSFHDIGDNRYYRDILESVPTLI